MPFCWWRLEGIAIIASDRRQTLGVSERRVAVERVDRREPVVAGSDAVAARLLEVVEERADQRRVELVDVEFVGLLAGLVGGEGE